MGISPAYLDFIKNKEGRTEMTDVMLARSLVQDIGGKGRIGDMIFGAFETLRQKFPHSGEPHKQWTERRLRAWWNKESENVYHWQMLELFQAAEEVKKERELIEAARREHAEFIAKTARIRSFLERQDEDFHSAQIEGLGSLMGGLDCSGNRGD